MTLHAGAHVDDFTFGLNTSTIRPAELLDKIRIAGEVGYDAIELWIADVEEYVRAGGTIPEVRKALDDRNLARPSMIALRGWCVPDEAEWKKFLDQAKKPLEIARSLGVERIVASPPREKVDTTMAIERYAQLLEFSANAGVPASVEFLGFVEGINNLDIAWKIAMGAGDSRATITPDIWHIFRGDSRLKTLDEIDVEHISCFHWNDAPAVPPRAEQTDAHRVYPGDGIMPLGRIARTLREKGYSGCLTLELFNPEYWKEDPKQVARIGLEKMRRSVSPT